MTDDVYPLDDYRRPRGNGRGGLESRALDGLDQDMEVDRLARLPAIEYDRQRAQAADRLGCRVRVLDDLVRERREALKPPEGQEPKAPPKPADRYIVTEDGTFTADREPLANYAARITREIVRTDGEGETKELEIQATKGGVDAPLLTTPVERFPVMAWSAQLPPDYINEPGQTKKDTLRHAIQVLSTINGPIPRHTIYTMTGWVHHDGRDVYLHAAGGIDAAGHVDDVEVDLGHLEDHALPPPSATDTERREAAEASFGLYNGMPDLLGITLTSAVYMAPLASDLPPDFLPWIQGASRSMKSSAAAAFLNHYGAAYSRLRLPPSWNGTANALEQAAHTLKDAMNLVDDYAPQPSPHAMQTLNNHVSQFVRAVGNRSGRARLTRSMEQRRAFHPRGLVVSTAEMIPPGESINARIFVVPVTPGQIDRDVLTQAQKDGADGVLARALADYIRHLAGRRAEVAGWARKQIERQRQAYIAAGVDNRAAEQAAQVYAGIRLALRWWRELAILTEAQERAHREKAATTLKEAANDNMNRVLGAQPAEDFVAALVDLLATGQAYLEPADDGKVPGEDLGKMVGLPGRDRNGTRIGWFKMNDAGSEATAVYLQGSTTLDMVASTMRRAGTPLLIQPRALYQQLQQRGVLLEGNTETRGKRKVQRNERRVHLGGALRWVLSLDPSHLWPPEEKGDSEGDPTL